VEGHIFYVVGKSHHTSDQLNKRMDKECKFTLGCFAKSQYPNLGAIVELPAVNVFECIRR